MDLGLFNSFCAQAAGNGVLLYYTGEISSNAIATMGDTVRHRLEAVEADAAARRKVFSAFVEMAQNILHYAGDGTPEGGRTGTLAVGRNGGKYYVLCGNLVRREHVERLRGKLEPLRTMTHEEIRAAYRAQLRNDAHEESDGISKGAGLGLLTLAREASEPIEYQIVYRSGESHYAEFYLRAAI